MGQVVVGGQTFDIYGEHIVDAAGPPAVRSARNYFLGSTHAAAFTAAASADQARALVTASRMFDRVAWVGTRTDVATPQPLAWPRTGVPAKDGVVVIPTEIPERVVFGAYELANALLGDAAVQTNALQSSNTRRTLATDRVEGAVTQTRETEFFRPGPGDGSSAKRFPTIVSELVGCFLDGGLTDVGLAFASGTDVETAFDGVQDQFGVVFPGLP